MAVKTYREAITEALQIEMRRDPRVIILGEDVVGGLGGTNGEVEAAGGTFGVTAGFAAEFGRRRVIDTPITESAIVGAANGAALTGLRPVAEVMFMDFIGVCLDQMLNQMAKFRYMFGGKCDVPVVIRTLMGAGFGAGPQHSQSLHALLTAIPGLKVALPSSPADAKGLLATAIRDNDPVIFCEHKVLYGESGEVPDGEYLVPFGEANVTRRGNHVTIVAFSRMVLLANAVADRLAKEGISVEVIDPRTTSPLDRDSILESVEKTGRLVVVDEGDPYCGMASEIVSLAATEALDALKAAPVKVTPPHTPVPATPHLEQEWLPSPDKIEKAVRATLDSKLARAG
ncbi:MAG: alpha-ketoacid dehydrogenase subunit beta [Steroidobacteraceae bacterium]|jgi:pyruvate dehydrogenase E1 component beta subunit|nr:alpha-ketoacid dehydrogenase subunit beta [Steroidobacteraceae bacterium]